MNVLLIGGTRFLGAAIARESVRRGYDVTVFHRGETPGNLPEEVRHCFGNARERLSLEPVLAEGKFDVIVDTILSAEDLRWILPLAQRFSGQLIHCGSTGVYAPAAYVPIREHDPTPCPPELGGFGSKLAQDEVLLEFFAATGFPVCSMRVSNVFGAGDVPLDGLGGRDPSYFQAIADDKEVYLPLDGKALLQPVHTEDLARAFCDAMGNPNAAGQIYNLSSDRAVTLRQYVETAKYLLGSLSSIRYVTIPEALAMPNVNRAGLLFLLEHMSIDWGKAARDLRYMPRVSLREGLEDSFRWMIQTNRLRVNARKIRFLL